MALSALRARLGVGVSRTMIVNAAVGAAGRTTGNANSFSRTLKVVGNNTNLVGGFSKIRRFSDIAGFRLPEQITADTTLFGQYSFALYVGGILGASAILWGLAHVVSERRDRKERQRYLRYDDDVKHDDVLQFDDRYVDTSMDTQDQLVTQWRAADDRKLAVSQWQAADDRKIAQFEANIADLQRAVKRFDLRPEFAQLREELLRAGTTDETLEIRKEYDDMVEDVDLLASQWRSAADLKLAEYKRKIMEVRARIQEVERRQKGL